ncbi:excinuclease ABC subunit UvrA [Roseivirga spongicola]|uniref:UvrABC system protein A n=1 Tax=Roseivirga spongicola TaxID=333140 RepID=A0A150X3L2_9BACT|nr:excinuclease ABC subunit UvrA [Roseivirga spongicola]KYG73306.1 hypothetical protein AWW68_11390 [Roseivirga spongicola]WPZ10078.1 ATP-binding cassette domain-containing protein [Roseivirga spongicola]
MQESSQPAILIKGAKANNLKDISLKIPHNQLIVVTGISGSGKSSLVFDIIAQEGQRRYFETLPSFARKFMGKLNRPEVDEIEGLSPVIAIGQRTSGSHARSTVGTLTDIHDLLRLLFARTGETQRNIKPTRSLFSFNSSIGKCPRCNGIGQEEQIDVNKLVAFPEKTIREGALATTLPNGYITYSQVTIDVLNQVCEAEGFSVDVPWNDLTDAQRHVILHGSDKIKVPFGKHTLESRLRWTGMKAKPREEGYYKGILTIMADILKRDRNPNILRFVSAVTCPECHGARLNQDALSVRVQDKNIAEVSRFELNELKAWIEANNWNEVATEIVQRIKAQTDLLADLGLGHLTLDRPSASLRASEIQRIRVANQILVPLSDVLYVFDEPSIGLHWHEKQRMIHHFKELVRKGNTVIVVEHDLATIKSADHIIEIGPEAGVNGGELIFNGALSDFLQQKDLAATSPTFRALQTTTDTVSTPKSTEKKAAIELIGCSERNLKNIDVSFHLGQLNVVSGRSGAGKSSLVKGTLLKAVEQQLGVSVDGKVKVNEHRNLEAINKLIFIDHSPIGKTPRSNPATYLGLSDYIRDIFAQLPESKERKFTKSRFSFNNKGGRCETCQGAGKIQIGMHFLGNVELVCGTCNGDRFNQETLEVKYKGLSIADVYRLSVIDAVAFFSKDKKVLAGLQLLEEMGLGYLTLGQSSSTLSGGEAQRIKIANQLQKKDTGDTLYVIIEPSIGLHHDNIHSLLRLFERIKQKGNTIVCIEQNETVIAHSDWHIELGPESGQKGGTILYQGVPQQSRTRVNVQKSQASTKKLLTNQIFLEGVTTHGLKNVDVRVPKNKLTVVTGLSGSGKSSLVYDTLFAESNARFTESLSTYHRSFLQQNSEAEIKSFSGLGPAIGINRRGGSPSKRSTVGTQSTIHDAFRLLYSRIAQHQGEVFTAQHFSFNHYLGACPACEGMGIQLKCDPEAIIVNPRDSVFEGAVSTNKAIAYYADVDGQFMATLKEVAHQKSWNLEQPWQELDPEIQEAILYGTGNQIWETTWQYKTKTGEGQQEIKAPWKGFCRYIDEEYQRRLHNKKLSDFESLMHEVTCATCQGSRLKPELLTPTFLGKNIHELSSLSISECLSLLEETSASNDSTVWAIAQVVLPSVKASLQTMIDLGLGYLNLDRAVSTLSGGERQRVTLAGQLSKHLFGVIYVLDEPTIGLDEEQVLILSKALKKLVSNGNTVVVVEHDPVFIGQADYLIEMGPEAGRNGGELIYQGTVEGVSKVKESVTAQLLNERRENVKKSENSAGQAFGVKGAFAHNLKQINVDFFAGQITAITGVSGSGKSSLVKEVLYRSWEKGKAINCSSVFGLEQFSEVLMITQEGLTVNRLTTPVSYTGILDELKAIYAKTESANAGGWKRADFSYQSKRGKCPTCAGYGMLKTTMDFMSDIWLTCDTCQGTRYNQEILEVTFQGKSIGEVLQLTVQEAVDFFQSSTLVGSLNILKNVGLGHLILGQSGNTLSGGESQRLKLANSMIIGKSKKGEKGATLYLFDEPSTGLHYFDILQLNEVFQLLIDQGDTIIFIEHNKTMIASADRVIKLGPASGERGGELV